MKTKLLPIGLLIAAFFCLNACKKDTTTTPDPAPAPATPGAPAITSSFYFQAKIDGTWVTFQDGVGGFASGMAGENYGSNTNQEEQSALLVNYSTSVDGYIFMLKTFPTSTPSGSDYMGMYSVGSFNYGINADTPGHPAGVDGAGIGYVDASGVEWRTDEGTANQSGSTFHVTEYINNTDGYSPKIVGATFSCKLYDNAGHTKTVTDGRFRGRVIIY